MGRHQTVSPQAAPKGSVFQMLAVKPIPEHQAFGTQAQSPLAAALAPPWGGRWISTSWVVRRPPTNTVNCAGPTDLRATSDETVSSIFAVGQGQRNRPVARGCTERPGGASLTRPDPVHGTRTVIVRPRTVPGSAVRGAPVARGAPARWLGDGTPLGGPSSDAARSNARSLLALAWPVTNRKPMPTASTV